MPASPLTPLTYHVLLSLAGADRHGYAIIKDIEERVGKAAAPGTGALYLALQRLEEAGFVEESPERPDPEEDDARRRYYRLTAAGRGAAEEESRHLADLVRLAAEKRLLPGGGLRAARAGASGRRS